METRIEDNHSPLKLAILIICLICFGLILSGCTTSPTLTKSVYKVVKPADSMISTCKVSAPPEKQSYSTSTAQEKEKTMYGYALSLLGDMTACNKQWLILQKWYVDQELIYKGQ
jgi:hypothetical protein